MILQHVPNFELCKELKRLGYPQEAEFYWIEEFDGVARVLNCHGSHCRTDYSAPLVSEMAEWIIGKKYVCPMWNEFNGSWILNHPASGYSYRGSMPDAFATQCCEILKAKEKV